MAKYKIGGHAPQVAKGCFVAREATLIGQVALASGCSVWPGATIHADSAAIQVGANTNIQEGAILHVDPGQPLTFGAGVTVGHQAMLHGCTVGDGSLIASRQSC